MSAPSLLSAATAVSRSASGIVAKAVRGFQVLRIDGYSLTKTMLPSSEKISNTFMVGERVCHVDYYPNGADRSKPSSDYISLYLRLHQSGSGGGGGRDVERVQAEYKFSLLDAAGDAAYERPAQTSVFTCSRDPEKDLRLQGLGCGHGEFISREELERRRGSLLVDDCLVVRCDVGFLELEKKLHLAVAGKSTATSPPTLHDDGLDCSDYESD